MNLTLEEITEHVGGRLHGAGTADVRGYSIDSRTIKRGELFFAIKGPRFDGHEFVEQAAQRNAAGIVVSEAVPSVKRLARIEVSSTRDAMAEKLAPSDNRR